MTSKLQNNSPSYSLGSFRYRYDLDGLRGVAIALVVIYHVFIGRVSGGVDVFLLLSGYFFLGSQIRYADKPGASLNPWWPIWRTLRRLVPALILTLGATYLLVRLWVPQLMRTEFVQQITASILYFQNWELARQDADYSAASASTSPLQHLWSMSVQGQLYLIFIIAPLALAAFLRVGHRAGFISYRIKVHTIAGPILVLVTIVSFVYASRFGLYAPAGNYYDTWARTWELSLGGVLSIYGQRFKLTGQKANIATGTGLAAICVTGMLISNSTAYPGPLSLLPLGGAILIVLSGGSYISQKLATKAARWLGDIAYPLYLWHWPLLIVSTAALGQEHPAWWLGAGIVALSVGLAHLTHRYFEAPLRQHHSRPLADDMPVHRALGTLRTQVGRIRGIGGVVVALATIGLLAVQPAWMGTVGKSSRIVLDSALYPGAMAFNGQDTPAGLPVMPDPILVGGIAPPTTEDHCFVAKQSDADYYAVTTVRGTPCLYGDVFSQKNVYLVGGSHAEQWTSTLDKLGKELGFKVIPLVRQDCPMEFGSETTVTAECKAWSEGAFEQIISGNPTLVVSTSTRPTNASGIGPDIVPPGYAAFWEKLAQNDIPFLGLRDNPWGFDENHNPREFDKCYVELQDAQKCGMHTKDVYSAVDPAAQILSTHENMLEVDTSKWFCKDGICPVVIGNIFVYRDMHHISVAFADSTVPLLRPFITPFIEGKTVQQKAPSSSDAIPTSQDSNAATPQSQPSSDSEESDTTVNEPVPYVSLWLQNPV